MIIEINSLKKQPNTKFKINELVELGSIILNNCPHKINGKIKFVGDYYMEEDNSVIIQGSIVVPMQWFCDRCGDEFEKNLFCEFKEKLVDNNSEEYQKYEEHINTSEIIKDIILFNIPSKVLCNEHCKGRCPKCGINLNYETCDCEKQMENINPFAKIKDKITRR